MSWINYALPSDQTQEPKWDTSLIRDFGSWNTDILQSTDRLVLGETVVAALESTKFALFTKLGHAPACLLLCTETFTTKASVSLMLPGVEVIASAIVDIQGLQ